MLPRQQKKTYICTNTAIWNIAGFDKKWTQPAFHVVRS